MPTPEQIAEEERQNRALIEAYQPDAPPNTTPVQFKPGGQMDQAATSARQELAFQPQTQTQTQAQTPAVPQPAQDRGPQYQATSQGTRILNALPAVGGMIKSIGALRVSNQMRGRLGGAQPAVDRLARSGERQIAQSAQNAAQEEHAQHQEQRQNWQDTQAAQDRNAARARSHVEDQFSAEARDPNSTKSKNLRSEIKTAFPKFAEDMGPGFESMSLMDFAKSPHPGLDKAKFDTMTERQRELLGLRGQQATDLTKLKGEQTTDLTTLKGEQAQGLEGTKQKGRVELKQMPSISLSGKMGGGAGGTSGPAGASEYEQALEQEFGGKDKIPATLLAQLHAAIASGKPAQIRMVMQSAHGQHTAATKVDEPAQEMIARTRDLRETLKSVGIDPDRYQGQDIPGEGRFKSMLPDAMVSGQGQQVRAAILSTVLGMQQALAHVRTSDAERAAVAKSLGAIRGGDPRNIIWGLHRMEAFAKEKLARSQATPAPAPAQGGLRVKTQDGKVHAYSGTAEQAVKSGYQVVQ